MTSSQTRTATPISENIEEAKRRVARCIENREESLDLRSLNLVNVPEEVAELTWLTELRKLYLYLNPIRTLPATLSQLTKLTTLNIADGTSSAADPVIGTLKNLRILVLGGVGLNKFPDWILDLEELRVLDLFDNDLRKLPESLGKLSELEFLRIDSNPLQQLPSSLLGLKNLVRLYVDAKLRIPKEITESRDAKKILDYYFRIRGERHPLNEFKLILVRRGGVGKTALVHRLTMGKYKEFKRTPGIKITKWPVQIDADHVQAHIWDFGGQEIVHGTHRFFMTER